MSARELTAEMTSLTPRQIEALRALIQHHYHAPAAAALGISEAALDKLVQAIRSAYGSISAAAFALGSGAVVARRGWSDARRTAERGMAT